MEDGTTKLEWLATTPGSRRENSDDIDASLVLLNTLVATLITAFQDTAWLKISQRLRTAPHPLVSSRGTHR